ncbi:MAG: hypothetical protein KC910_27760 [Candidatus Eremiobacteraeota bacterium]|nr:hypothetical protein [Candidatus Eremiobacteraeota bacterium]
MLLGLVTQFLIPAMRYSAEGNMKVDLQQRAILAINRLVADLQRTNATGVTLALTAPVTVGIVRIEKIGADGFPSWDDEMQVYWYDDVRGDLHWETYPPSPPSLPVVFSSARPATITPSDLQSIAIQTSGAEHTLARDVTAFSVQDADPDPGMKGLLRIDLSLEKEIPHTARKATVEMTRFVQLRNAP